MMRPPGRPKEKTAVALPGNTTASQRSQQANATPEAFALASTPISRALSARLAQLGLTFSGAGDEILIAGQSYDLHTATAMARQLGASS
jgi:hypothetical protein